MSRLQILQTEPQIETVADLFEDALHVVGGQLTEGRLLGKGLGK